MSRLVRARASHIGIAIVMSATLPGVTATTRIRPRPSARQWIFVVRPPRETPTACASSPLFPRCRAVGLQGRHPLRVHLQNLDRAAASVHHCPDTPHLGTEHLAFTKLTTLPICRGCVRQQHRENGEHFYDPGGSPCLTHTMRNSLGTRPRRSR
jgi:hypothetical protein